MIERPGSDTRTRLIESAADLIASSPGEDFSLRAVCDAVGVKMPTLYHFFGSKAGLVDAVVERGFDLYLGQKAEMESSGDPIQDIRAGWDAHVAFGLANPGFYSLMYGQVRPGYSPAAQRRASDILRGLTRRAEEQGRLGMPADQAAAHVLVCNIGVTLRQVIQTRADEDLSASVREGAIAAITSRGEDTCGAASALIERAAARADVLGETETRLLIEWLSRLRDGDPGESRPPRSRDRPGPGLTTTVS